LEGLNLAVPRQFIEDFRQALDEGFRLIAHWLNSQPPVQRAGVKIEPCSPHSASTIEGCRNKLANLFIGIRPYAPNVPREDRDIHPWTLGCLNQKKQGLIHVCLHCSEAPESLEEKIERLVGIHHSYGWTAEDWRVCVKEPVEKYAEEWRAWLSGLEEPAAEADGPFGVEGFHWKGTSYFGLTAKPFRLVQALWSAKHRTLSLDHAEAAVYGPNDLPPDSGLPSLRRQINAFFRANGIPWNVTVRGGSAGAVALVHTAPKL
jgi:hypothetical protein